MRRATSHRRFERGQSLIEVAFSTVIFVLLVSGLVDLGRAWFTKVSMDSVISEGANWGAAYPGCIPSATNTTSAPQVDPKCQGTNSVLCRMMNENIELDPNRVIDLSVSPINAGPGDMVTLSVTYRLPVITPIMQFLFGNNLTLTTQVQEVVRGTDIPENPGDSTLCNQGGVNPVLPVTNALQNPPACNAGMATFTWDAVSATGYHIWYSHITSGFTSPDVTISPAGTPGTTFTWQDPSPVGVGGNAGHRDYTITTYNLAGTLTESTPVYFSGDCTAIQATGLTFTGCSANGAYVQWTPLTPVDLSVAGWQMINATTNALKGAPFAANASTGNFVFPSNPPDGTEPYYMRAVDSGVVPIGLSSNTIGPLPCPPTNAEISISSNSSPVPGIAGSSLTYVLTVANAGPAQAQGVVVTFQMTARGGAAFTYSSATPSQGGTCGWDGATNTVTCSSIGNINNGASATVTVVINPTAAGTIDTNAGVTETTRQIYYIDDTAPGTTTIIPASSAYVRITKQGPVGSVAAGASITYTLTVITSGTGTLTNVVVNDPTPPGLTWLNNTGACTTAFPCNLGSLLAGDTKMITATYRVPVTYSSTTVSNTATVSSPDDPSPSGKTSTVNTTVTAPAVQNFRYLSCTRSGSKRTYTFAWDAYTWPGVDHYRITDQSQSPAQSWSSGGGTGSQTQMSVPPSGWLSKSYNNDQFYVEAMDASGNVIGSKSVPSVTTTCN